MRSIFVIALLTGAAAVAAQPHNNYDESAALVNRAVDVAVEANVGAQRRHHEDRRQSRRSACKKRAGKVAGSLFSPKVKNNAALFTPQAASQPKAQPTTSAQPKSQATTAPAPASGSNSGSSSPAGSGVSAFAGTNSNAILSWFRTNAGQDSTNGRSWCQTPYKDDWMCFAPSVGTMLKEFGGNYEAAAKAFCGREAIVTDTKTGKSITAFICDGFDDYWVRTPASLDLTVGAFTALHGSFDNNKNTVMQGATWKLTGNVVQQGTFKAGL